MEQLKAANGWRAVFGLRRPRDFTLGVFEVLVRRPGGVGECSRLVPHEIIRSNAWRESFPRNLWRVTHGVTSGRLVATSDTGRPFQAVRAVTMSNRTKSGSGNSDRAASSRGRRPRRSGADAPGRGPMPGRTARRRCNLDGASKLGGDLRAFGQAIRLICPRSAFTIWGNSSRCSASHSANGRDARSPGTLQSAP